MAKVEVQDCMDFRVGQAVNESVKGFEEKGYSVNDIAVYRTAGPMSYAMGLEERIKDPQLKVIMLQPHSDCGLAKVCHAILSGNQIPLESETQDDVNVMVNAIRGKMTANGMDKTQITASTLQDVEALIPVVLREMVSKMIKDAARSDIELIVEPVNHNHLRLNGSHTDNVIVVIGPTTKSDSDLKHEAQVDKAYVVQVSEAQFATSSLDLAASVMKKTNFMIIPGNPASLEKAKAYSEAIHDIVGPNASVTLVKNGHVKVK